MSILGYNGRNRIAAPIMHSVPHSIEDVWEPNALTHGHEWRAGATSWANRNRLHHPSRAGTRFIRMKGPGRHG